MGELIGDGSMELQSISKNNNLFVSTIESENAAKPPPQNTAKALSVVETHRPAEAKSKDASAEPVSNRTRANMGTSKGCIGVLFAFAAILITAGVTLGIYWMVIYNSILLKELILTPTSNSFGMWQEIPVPMYLNLYLYNWTNPEEFVTGATVKPNFVEMGPYVFREQHVKVNKTWNDNGTITYQQRRFWQFEESLSNGTLDDNVTNINVIATTVGHAVRDQGWLARRAVHNLLVYYGETFTVTKTARELLFEGYADEFLEFALRLNNSWFDIPFDKFGWFYARNGSETYDGVFNMHTGVEDVLKLGVIDQWNYGNYTNFWRDECSEIRGTSGELWPPLTQNDTVEIFAPDICTSMILHRTNDSTFLGVTGHTFAATSATFDNGTNVPSRACYCADDYCQPSGTLDVSECKFNAPAYVGLPHFHLADESYADAVTGLDPLDTEHNFELTLEPNTGIPLNVRAQLQINILVQPVGAIDMFTNIPTAFIPVLWFRQEVQLTDEYASQIRLLLRLPTLGQTICIVIACIGLLLGLTAIYLCIRRKSQAGDHQHLIVADQTGNAPKTDTVNS